MRPRKRILLIDPVEDRRGITSFVLENTIKYRVLTAPSVWEASKVAHDDERGIDLLLGYAPVCEDYLMDLADDLQRPHLFIKPLPNGAFGNTWPSMEMILECVRIASLRKRGPRKGAARVQPEALEVQLVRA